jgi:urea carboxylase
MDTRQAAGWAGIPDCVLARHEHDGGKPTMTYRAAGDWYLLVEYGEMELDLALNFFVHSVDARLRDGLIAGVGETSPGFRSVLVAFDAGVIAVRDLITELERVHADLPGADQLVLPSRIIRLPAAFDDTASRDAVARYNKTIRPDAPNCAGGSNIDYTLRYNGLDSLDDLAHSVTSTDLWVGFIGFFPGLPFMFPLDPRHVLFAPKYNPTRTWTAEGAIGLGGPCYSIYPVESPGGYQLLGRTIPVYDINRRNKVFEADPLLLRPGDRIRFHQVEEGELLEMFEAVHADRYDYRIEEEAFDVAAHLAWCASHQAEADERARARDAAAAATPVP